jgi:acyl-CoA dehydrogenase
MRETLVERLWRDARLYPIGGGTREIMNELISKMEGY